MDVVHSLLQEGKDTTETVRVDELFGLHGHRCSTVLMLTVETAGDRDLNT
jgi:hypothetical protein